MVVAAAVAVAVVLAAGGAPVVGDIAGGRYARDLSGDPTGTPYLRALRAAFGGPAGWLVALRPG